MNREEKNDIRIFEAKATTNSESSAIVLFN